MVRSLELDDLFYSEYKRRKEYLDCIKEVPANKLPLPPQNHPGFVSAGTHPFTIN